MVPALTAELLRTIAMLFLVGLKRDSRAGKPAYTSISISCFSALNKLPNMFITVFEGLSGHEGSTQPPLLVRTLYISCAKVDLPLVKMLPCFLTTAVDQSFPYAKRASDDQLFPSLDGKELLVNYRLKGSNSVTNC